MTDMADTNDSVHLLVCTAELPAYILHLTVFVIHFRLFGEVLVLQVLELGHCSINDLHVSVLLLIKQRVQKCYNTKKKQHFQTKGIQS